MMTLHGYWRSSASYRVRIALALKGVEVKHVAVNLREGEQSEREHIARNPQGFVPVLELEDGIRLTQSLAIMDYLDATFRKPNLMPSDAVLRSKILSASLIIASDIAPIQNLSVLKYLRAEYEQGDDMFFECCLIPQIYNARRFGVDMDRFPKLKEIDARCRDLPAFQTAAPENQHDAP